MFPVVMKKGTLDVIVDHQLFIHVIQNIFCVEQKKEARTGLSQLEG